MPPEPHGTSKRLRYDQVPKEVFDYVAVGLEPGEEHEPYLLMKLRNIAREQIVGQYRGRLRPLLTIHPMSWHVTSSIAEVEAYQPAHDCPECRAGNVKAAAWLREHPGQSIALGNLHYSERWPV
jgi:hypothetical protein